RTVTCVYDRDLVSVDMVILETEPCVWEISFHFFIYCSDFNPENVCCYWVWCPCGENSIGPPEAEDCGFAADYCDDRPGQWTLITNMSDGECAEQNPPCIKGDYHGQVEVNCYDW